MSRLRRRVVSATRWRGRKGRRVISEKRNDSGLCPTPLQLRGTRFGPTRGSSTVTFGGAAANIVSWSDTAIFATVPSGLVAGQTVPVIVTATAGASNPADFLPVTTTAPFAVSPQEVNLLVGQTRTISVTDSNGNALTGLLWDTSNPSVVSLSTDDPPVLTGVAPGSAVVYVVGMPILVTVYSGTALPAGAPIWSVPASTSTSGLPPIAVPAVPSASGADLFVLDDNGLRALATDGSTVWSVAAEHDSSTQVIPDFAGSTFLKEPIHDSPLVTHVLKGIDPSTHQLSTLYTFTPSLQLSTTCWGIYMWCFTDNFATQTVIPHPSGVVFVLDAPFYSSGCQDPTTGNNIPCVIQVKVLDPSTGQILGSVSLENSSSFVGEDVEYWYINGYPLDGFSCYSNCQSRPSIGNMIVAGDGNAYLPYFYGTETASSSGTAWNSILDAQVTAEYDLQSDSYLMALRVSPDGTYAKTQLDHWTREAHWNFDTGTSTYTTSCAGGPWGDGGPLTTITNADGGAAIFAQVLLNPSLLPTQLDPSGACGSSIQNITQISYVSQNGLGSQVNAAPSVFSPTLQRADGSYIGTDGTNNLIALGLDGSVVWQTPTNDPNPVMPLYATADGGAIATSTTQCTSNLVTYSSCTPQLGTLYTVDQNGNVTSQTADNGTEYSWTGEWYDPPPAGGVISAVTYPQLNLAPTFAGILAGNHSGTPVGIQQVQTNQTVADVEQPPSSDAVSNSAYHSNYNSIELLTTDSPSYIFQNYIQTFAGVTRGPNDVAAVTPPTTVTAVGQIITFDLLGNIPVALANVCAPFIFDGICTPPYPFSVKVKGLDTTSQILSVVTLQGHPLRGRRYWRVFSIRTNDVVVETGAIDTSGPGPQNYIGYFLAKADQIKVWQEDLQYILAQLKKNDGTQQGANPTVNVVKGEWNDALKQYVWNFVCESVNWCN